jgi:site-specific DNA-methyltransferase (adenine-specific)
MDMKQIPHLLLYLEKETNFILNNQIIWDKGDWRALSWLNPTQDNNLRSWFTTTEYCYMFTKQDVDGGSKYKNNLVYKSREYIRSEIIRAKGKISLKEINSILGTASNGGGVASSVLSLDKAKPTFMTKEHYKIIKEWLNENQEYEYLRKEYEDLRYTFNLEPLMNNIWKSNIRNDGSNHICEKPVDLIEKIIRVSSNKGDVVLDCFNGSGTTGIVANQLNRNYIGIELGIDNCEITKQRLNKLQMRLDI